MRIDPKKFLLTAICVLAVHIDVFASKVTVDADGGADYIALDSVLIRINSSSLTTDTIQFIGSDQDSYNWYTDMTRNNLTNLVFISTQTSPNLFPIICRTNGSCWAFMANTNLYFKNIAFAAPTVGTYAFTNAQSGGKTLSFTNCVIKDHSTQYFLKMEGGVANTSLFTNCLFEGNAKIFTFDYWDGSPTITITNCTFDANTELFSTDLASARATNVSIKNCIFSNNTATFPSGGVLKGKTTYSLTSESTSGYGTSCVSNSNPSYVSSSRANPADWMIQSGSPAINIGTSTGAPSTDISGYSRSSPDAGCWEYQVTSTPENYATWNYSGTIKLNTTSGGANVSNNVMNFPVLVRLNSGNFLYFSQTLAGGADIRFAKSDGTHLPYQIERWVDGSGNNDTAEIWVKVDTVYGNNATQNLKMYWGNSSAADSSSYFKSSVFSTSNGFVHTYHLGGDLSDATSNNNTGSDNSTVDTGSGIIGKARAFNGTSQYFTIGDVTNRSNGAISFWFRPKVTFNSSSATQGIYGKYTNNSQNSTLSLRGSDFSGGTGSAGSITVKIEDSTGGYYNATTSTSWTADTWYHIAWSWKSGADSVYVNGLLEASATNNVILKGTAVDEIGRSSYDIVNVSSTRYFNGTLDEFRVDNSTRSADWVKLCYENQKTSQSLVNISGDFTWDVSTSSGIQTGNGTWGTSAYWTLTGGAGTILYDWPGAGCRATFGGSDGAYAITVSGTQYVDSITFSNSGYKLSGGTAIDLGTKSGIYIASGKYDTISTPINGTGGITLSGSGTLVLNGTNIYTGTTTINGGTLQIGAGSTAGVVSNSSNISDNSALVFNRSDSYTYSGVISGSGTITKSGAGTTTLSGNHTHTGTTTVNAGTLRLTGTPTSNARKFVINTGGTISVADRLNLGPAPGSVTADWVTLNGGTLSSGIASGQNYGSSRGFTLGASGGTIDIPYTDNTNIVQLYGVISGSGALTKTGNGTLALMATNTFSGGVTVNDGILAANNTAALGNSANTITVNNGGSIDVSGINLQGYTNAITINGQVSSDTGALTNFGTVQYYALRKIALGSNASIGCNGARFDIGRGFESTTCITGNGYTLTKVGNNTIAFLASGTTLGAVAINAGRLSLEKADAVGTAAITVNSGGSLITWFNLSFTNNLILNGGILLSPESNSYSTTWSGGISVISASTLQSSADNTTTLSGAITGTGSLTKTGAEGVYILSGNSNTYSGGTTISGSTLRVTNTSGSATGTGSVTVSSGGTLEGTGTASGATAVSGTLSPGVSGPGRLTFGSNITFSSGATFNVQLNGTTASSGYDQVVMSSGTLSLGSATLSLTFGYTPTINDAYTIIDNQGSNAVSGTFSGLAQGATKVVSYNGVPYDCQISYTGGTGNDVAVTVLRISAEDYANEWGFSQVLLLNTTSTGANVSGNVLNFPVLLRLNPGNFDGFANTQPGGKDIRFAKTNGAKLSYQIEGWKDYDNDADTAEIWVKIDTVYGNNKTQTFLMYWGKSDAADSSMATKVFDTACGFRGVWHLNTSGTGSRPDATYMNNSASTSGASFTSAGAIAGCDTFVSASSQYDSVASGGINLANKNITVMAWVKMDNAAPAASNMFVGQGPNAVRQGLHIGYRYSTTRFTFALYSDDLDQLNAYSGGTNWQFVACTFNTSDKVQKLYMNGALDNSRTAGGNYTGTGVFRIGRSYNTAGDFFGGKIDEVVVSDSVRSADWVRLCYENQKTDQTLVSYEDYSTWGFSRNITINTSGITTTNCTNFPMLVRLTSTTFDFNQARDSGQDIRFSKSNGTRLPYQIERWNKSSSLAEIWVRIDTVYGSNSTQYFKMYWGKSVVSSKSNGPNVFDSTNGFQGVWHMDEGTGNISDATVNGYSGSRSGNVSQVAGGVGYGQTFDGTDDYFTVTSLTKVLFGTVFTASAWLYIPSSVTSAGALWSQSDGDANWEAQETQFFLGDRTINSSQQGRYPQFVGNSRNWMNPTSALGTDGWHYATYVYRLSDNTRQIYINGTSEVLTTANYGGGTDPGTTFIIGNKISTDVNNDFNGRMDELRVENVVRSADWIRLCYETQKTSPTIITSDSADAFRPLSVKRYGTSSAPDSIYVGTNRWALRFSKNKGGGVKFLASDTASSNQLDANLFYIVYKSNTSDTGTGTITLLDSSIVFSRIRQTKSIAGMPFNIDYTVLGSGKMYIRVSTTTQSSLSGGLAFRIANNATASYRNIAFGSTAATCDGVAHIDSTAGKYDLIMAPFERWSDANQIESNSRYTGLSGTSWNPPAGKRYRWEFMVDFGHKALTDSSLIAKYILDYRNSDTLGFYAGTSLLEQAWEEEEMGEWQFEEGSGSSVIDKTGRGHTATISGTPSWTSGKWYTNAIHLGGSDSVTVPHTTNFNGTNQQHTISAWIKPDVLLSSSVSILKKLSSSGVGYSFTGGASGTLRYNMSNGGSTAQLQSSQVLTPGSWYHVAATMYMLAQLDYLALYINGKLDTLLQVELDPYYGTSSSNLVIGELFQGNIDDVRYYNQLLTEEEIRTIYLKGFSPERGMYRLRANNDNTIHTMMHGTIYNRFLPVMQVSNYWATALPTYVYIDGVGLTSGTDYYAALDDNRNQLTIGFNRTINRASTIFIDNNLPTGQKENGPTKKMYWGIAGSSNEYFWVKNTSGRYFDALNSHQFYLNWKMNTASNKDGEIWHMRHSRTNPYTLIDTATGTNLIPGDGTYYVGFGAYSIDVSTTPLRTTSNVSNSFTYTVEESSQVRVRLRINERQVSGSGQSFNIVTKWTIYPFGQLFRYDSIYGFSSDPSKVFSNVFMRDSGHATATVDASLLRGVNVYSQDYPDFAGAWLSMKNGSGFQATPFSANIIGSSQDQYRSGFEFMQYSSAPANWTSALAPIQTCIYFDFHTTYMNSSSKDSVGNGVQCSRFVNRRALSMITGTLDSTTHGDFSDGIIAGGDNSGDGFNEMEGAYIINATDNTVAFKLPAKGDTCRFYPAFRIKNYTSVNRPKYVFLFKGLAAGDTVALLEGYQYNSYVNLTTDELILQIDSIFCDSVGIYISSDKTLAVELSKFEARPGNSSDTIIWRTESEQGNLGFQLFRRIKPQFYDSIADVIHKSTLAESQHPDSNEVISLFKKKAVNADDTGWILVNKELIPGAPSGNSQGPRDYRYIDRNLFNGILFEYRLVAIDEKQDQESHGPVAVMPRKFVPSVFMLGANYPNPFIKTTTIRFALPVESKVSLKIFTLQGRLVRTLLKPDRKFSADYHQIFWNGTDDHGQICSTGPYIYILDAGKYSKARVMLMIR